MGDFGREFGGVFPQSFNQGYQSAAQASLQDQQLAANKEALAQELAVRRELADQQAAIAREDLLLRREQALPRNLLIQRAEAEIAATKKGADLTGAQTESIAQTTAVKKQIAPNEIAVSGLGVEEAKERIAGLKAQRINAAANTYLQMRELGIRRQNAEREYALAKNEDERAKIRLQMEKESEKFKQSLAFVEQAKDNMKILLEANQGRQNRALQRTMQLFENTSTLTQNLIGDYKQKGLTLDETAIAEINNAVASYRDVMTAAVGQKDPEYAAFALDTEPVLYSALHSNMFRALKGDMSVEEAKAAMEETSRLFLQMVDVNRPRNQPDPATDAGLPSWQREQIGGQGGGEAGPETTKKPPLTKPVLPRPPVQTGVDPQIQSAQNRIYQQLVTYAPSASAAEKQALSVVSSLGVSDPAEAVQKLNQVKDNQGHWGLYRDQIVKLPWSKAVWALGYRPDLSSGRSLKEVFPDTAANNHFANAIDKLAANPEALQITIEKALNENVITTEEAFTPEGIAKAIGHRYGLKRSLTK